MRNLKTVFIGGWSPREAERSPLLRRNHNMIHRHSDVFIFQSKGLMIIVSTRFMRFVRRGQVFLRCHAMLPPKKRPLTITTDFSSSRHSISFGITVLCNCYDSPYRRDSKSRIGHFLLSELFLSFSPSNFATLSPKKILKVLELRA